MGTYAGLWLNKETQDALYEYFSSCVPNMYDAEKLHSTTTFSHKDVTLLPRDIHIVVGPETFEYKFFGSYFVIAFDHQMMYTLHQEGVNAGASVASYDYTPHVSITDNFIGDINTLPPIPTFPFVFDRYVVEELKKEF